MNFKSITLGVAFAALGASAAWADGNPISAFENRWAEIRYEMKDKAARLAALRDLQTQTKGLMGAQPSNADAMVWHAAALLLEADLRHDMSALGLAKEGRKVLERAETLDTKAQGGILHAMLGALYNEIPAWPIGFHDDDKSRAHFAMALELFPEGLDANYSYGDYLAQKERFREAIPFLEKAATLPPRSGHERYDTGLRGEAESALMAARERVK